MIDASDYDTPVEELPGILGYQWDDCDFVALDESVAAIGKLDGHLLQALQDVTEGCVSFSIETGQGPRVIEVDPFLPLWPVFNNLPSLDVVQDCPPDQGPGGGGYLFFIAEGATFAAVKRDVGALCAGLEEALKTRLSP